MSRTGALVWFCLISSLQKLLSTDSCHTSRRSMLPKSSTASVRWPIGWWGRSSLMSRREATFRRKSISLTAQILLIQMMTRWWDRLNGFRTLEADLMPIWQQGTQEVWVRYYKGRQDLRSVAVRGSDQVEAISQDPNRSRAQEHQVTPCVPLVCRLVNSLGSWFMKEELKLVRKLLQPSTK